MKKKYLLTALVLCGLMITGCGKSNESTKEVVTKTIKFDLPETHLKINDYLTDSKGHEGENKELLKNDMFSDNIFDTTTFEISGVFGPNNQKEDKTLHNIKLGSKSGVGAIEVGLNMDLISSIESIVLETAPHVQTINFNQETHKQEKVFIQDRYKISIDGKNFKETPEVTGTCLADMTSNKTTFTKEDCNNLKDKLLISNEVLIKETYARCFLKTMTINYCEK